MPYHRFIQANLDRLLDSPEKALLRVTKAKRRAQTFAKRSGRWVKRRWLLRSTSQFKASTSRSQALVPTSRGSDPTDLLTAEDRGSRFVLYRIIGNDLYPRHNEGQSLANLRFILEHESQFEGCEKRWLLNRIRDQSKLQGLIDVLESYGYGYDVIPFEMEAFKAAPWDWNVLPSPDYFVSKAYLRLNRSQREGFEVALYRNKNNYLMNNNGARNKALDLGRARADWVLPWDGNCFLTASGWQSLQSAVLRQSSADYFHVPMLRVSDNSQLLDPLLDAQPRDEPQLVLRLLHPNVLMRISHMAGVPKSKCFGVLACRALGMPGWMKCGISHGALLSSPHLPARGPAGLLVYTLGSVIQSLPQLFYPSRAAIVHVMQQSRLVLIRHYYLVEI